MTQDTRHHAGFTGTQKGMTRRQVASLQAVLGDFDVLHHGDCVGADEQAHETARDLGLDVVVHPPSNPTKRAWCGYPMGEGETRTADEYRRRNAAICAETEQLVAAPKGFEEELRSGTWMTVRIALKMGRPVTVIWPDGRIERNWRRKETA